MRFLTGPEIRTEVQRISRRPGKLRAAVAYWGDGAAERAGLSERENPEQVRIICDLLSGSGGYVPGDGCRSDWRAVDGSRALPRTCL